MATLEEVYTALFSPRSGADIFASAPLLPTDLFAFGAHLLERSGAYHHVAPDVNRARSSGFRELLVDDELRARAVRTGRIWRASKPRAGRRLPPPPSRVEVLWEELEQFRDEHVFEPLVETADAPEWWMICLELVMIADGLPRHRF